MKASEIAEALGGKKSTKGWMCKCPAHDDSTASLSVDDGDNGAPIVRCFAECSQSDIIATLDSRGLWERKKSETSGARKQVAVYKYNSADGQLRFEVVRQEPKSFLQRRPDGNGRFIWSTREIKKVPYRLPELIEAIGDERVVFIVEGEKDCDNLAALGVPATCNSGGAGKWQDELTQYFQGERSNSS